MGRIMGHHFAERYSEKREWPSGIANVNATNSNLRDLQNVDRQYRGDVCTRCGVWKEPPKP